MIVVNTNYTDDTDNTNYTDTDYSEYWLCTQLPFSSKYCPKSATSGASIFNGCFSSFLEEWESSDFCFHERLDKSFCQNNFDEWLYSFFIGDSINE